MTPPERRINTLRLFSEEYIARSSRIILAAQLRLPACGSLSGAYIRVMLLDGDDQRRKPFAERKTALRKVLKRTKGGIQYVEHTEGDGDEIFAAVCKLGLEGIVSKKLDSPYKSGPSKTWLKIKNPKTSAVTRAVDRTF
jgi:bifunctional non-homologous end joining protein LigD